MGRFWTCLIGAGAAFLFGGGCATVLRPWEQPPAEFSSAAEREAHNLRVFSRTVAVVGDRYFDAEMRGMDWPAALARHRAMAAAAEDDTELYEVINELLQELGESHTVALMPRHAEEVRTRQRAGAGFRMRRVDDAWVVTDVMPGSAAEAAGVQAGWVVRTRDGELLGPRLRFVNELGQTVTYGFTDAAGNRLERSMTAALISPESRLESRMIDEGDVLYLRFDEFGSEAVRWISHELKAHADAAGVVVDLRQNFGGLLHSLRMIVGEFFPRRVGLGTFVRRSGGEQELESYQWGSAGFAGGVVVLIDEFSASSAEIFAHVLRHHERAALVGRSTAGAVIGASFYALPGGGRLQVAVRDYVGLDGRRLEGNGVEPDIAVPLRLADLRAGRDRDLEIAIALLRGEAIQPDL